MIPTVIPKPKATKNRSRIKLYFAGLNRRDYWIQQGQYPRIDLPVVLGSDGLGIDETDGRRVFFNPGLNWGENQAFQQPEFQLVGMPDQGTLAEYISVPADKIYEVPDHLTDPEGACLPLAGVTAYRALFIQGRLQPGQKVLITGVGGGVASLAVKLALAKSAQVYINSSSDEKIETVISWGCINGWNYRSDLEWPQNAKEEVGGFDLILDGAGGETVKDYIDVLRPGGRLVAYGATLGPWTQVPAAKVFWKQIHLTGSTMGSDQDFADMVDFVREHQVRPHVDRVFSMDKANHAFEYLINPEAFGKIVIKINVL